MPGMLVSRRSSTLRAMPRGVSTVARPSDSCRLADGLLRGCAKPLPPPYDARYAVRIEGLSERAAARRFGIDPRTVAKMLAFSVPPGYRRTRPPVRPKLDPFTGMIDGILAADEGRPRKQRHTSKRIFERLRRRLDPRPSRVRGPANIRYVSKTY